MIPRCHYIYPYLARFYIWVDSEEVIERHCHQVDSRVNAYMQYIVLRVIYFLPKVVRTYR
jgi:hypothetical protein